MPAFCHHLASLPTNLIMTSIYALARRLSKYAHLLLITSTSLALSGTPPTCNNPQVSCQNETAIADTCCFNAPGGQLLQTQFWDYNPPTGPTDSWTVHGLWPDHCDGTYDANCDPARAYTNISSIISAAGATSLLDYMNKYWKDYQGNDESFWEHEWGKHGTCVSTLEPGCYNDYVAQEEVVDYFQKAVDLFKTLPSYTWLANAGITPSTTATYTSAQIFAALKAPRGVDVAIQCANSNEFDEIWYFYDVKGSIQTGEFIPTNPGTPLLAHASFPHSSLSSLPYPIQNPKKFSMLTSSTPPSLPRWLEILLPFNGHQIPPQIRHPALTHNYRHHWPNQHSTRHSLLRPGHPPGIHLLKTDRLHNQRRDLVHNRHMRHFHGGGFGRRVHAYVE